jgi:hypothetical protein
MDGQPERALRAGVTVCFRDEDTNALLWKARMGVLPLVGDVVTQIVDGVETEYRVESVKFEFLHRNVAGRTGAFVDGVPQYGAFTPSVFTHAGPIVIVSPV